MSDRDLERLLAPDHTPLPSGHRSGFVCIVGRPNVGKSTLLNAVVGRKVAIVTRVPGTTRNAIRGVLTRDDAQVVFIDTPGVAKPRTLLGSRLNELVRQTWSGVDVVLLMIDAEAGVGSGDEMLAAQLEGVGTPVVCVVNKQDRVGQRVLPVLERAAALGPWTEVVPTSATTGHNLERLVEILVGLLPEGPRFFPPGMVSDQPERQLVGEIIREKYLTRVFEEVPHSIAVVIEEFGDRGDGLVEVHATIYVERESQKGIVIGKGGQLLRAANTRAREELEVILGAKVFLDVRVKVAKDWQRDPKRLQRFGY